MTKQNAEMTEKQHGRVISAATDGACSGNPGPGGWGALIRYEDGCIEEFGVYEPTTTNNRMELQAVLEVLKRLKNLSCKNNLTIRTDSKYVINGFSHWIQNWKKNGWRTSSRKPVLNQDLWESLDKARLANVNLEYVKGHSGDPDNERVDEIAVSYSKGNWIGIHSDEKSNSSEPKRKAHLEGKGKANDPAPQRLQRLLSRLDMASHIAKHGYSLSLTELAELLEIDPIEIKQKKHAWQWRDWSIEPISESKWKLNVSQQKLSNSKKNHNG